MKFGLILGMAIVASLTLAAGLAAQPGDPAQKLNESETGRRALAYVNAFNSGDTLQMKAFFESNISAESLAKRSVAERLDRYHQMKRQMGGISIERVGTVSETAMTLFALNARQEWMELSFKFEPEAPHYLASLAIELLPEPPAQDEQTPLDRAQALEAINKLVDSLSAADIFSGTVLVALNDQPVVTRAVGMAHLGHRVPNKIDTKFNLGSINKIFTKTAIAQLIQTEKVRFDDPIGTYLIDYPNREAASKVTVRHLIDMTSGIGDFFGERFDNIPKNRLRTNSDFVPLFSDLPLEFEPGTDRRYSNGSYILLGAIIEAVSGQSYYQYVRDHIFTPAGMSNTESYEADAIVPNLAEGYTFGDEMGRPTPHLHANIYTRPARASAAGGGYSTAEDLHKFAIALRTGKLLDKRHTVWMFTRELPDKEPADLAAAIAAGSLGIAGGSLGMNAALEDEPSAGYTVVVMSNYDPPSAESLAQRIVRLLRRVVS